MPVFDIRLVLANFSVTIDFHAEVIARFLPVEFAIGDAEEVLNADFVTAGQLEQGDTCGCVFFFTHPVSDDVVSRTPSEISNALHLKIYRLYITSRRCA